MTKWKSRSEGKSEIKRLKGIVKSIQNGFDNFNQVFIIGVYDIALRVSATGNAISSRIARVGSLLIDFRYLDEMMQVCMLLYDIPLNSNTTSATDGQWAS